MAQTKEYYRAQPMAAGTSFKVGGVHISGFLATIAGTMTITDADNTVLVDTLPVAVGFNRIPVMFKTPAGGVVALTTAAGTLLL